MLRLILIAWALMAALLMLADLSSIASQRFPDPDDTLRLLEVRDWLGGQGWFDLHQHRIDPHDGGVAMHWSRLVDLPLAGMILLLRPLLGPSLAEQVTMVAVPLLTLLVVVAATVRLSWTWLGLRAAALSCLLLLLSGPLIAQIQPRRIDHHGWQVAMALVAINGLMMRNPRRIGHWGGWLAGLSLAIGLTISLESLPVAAGFALAGGWRWLRGGPERLWLAHYMAALATGTLALFAATRGATDLAMHCDQISPVHLAVFVWGALALTALGRAKQWPLWAMLSALGLTGGVALALYGGLAPQCRHGAFDMLTPRLQVLWYNNIHEGLPIWRQGLSDVVQTLVTPGVALLAALRLALRAPRGDRAFWSDYALVLAASIAVALLLQRASALAFALAAIPLGNALIDGFHASRRQPTTARRVGGLLLLVLVVEPTMPLTLWSTLRPAPQTSARTEPEIHDINACRIADAQALIHAPRGLVMAPLDIGPALLLAAPQSVLATAHHRGARAMDATLDAFTTSDAAARAIVKREGVTYIALCPPMPEPHIYADVAPHGLAAHLMAGKAPAWLTPMPSPPPLRLWRVVE
ncbi:hypothetical protein [Novosphingobium rosa]|uniref:hypothetical protein n=1 Tax=Novosphingobium rosa TaxID=76978 RepID=UPI0008370E81|nr:hypothetical protein [Novosphingobium rosa]